MAAAAAGAVALLWMHESHAPTVLQRKVRKARVAEPGRNFYTVFDLDLGHDQTKRPKAGQVLSKAIRPGEYTKRMYHCCIRLSRYGVLYLVLDPVLCLLSIYYAFVFGELYLLVTTVWIP